MYQKSRNKVGYTRKSMFPKNRACCLYASIFLSAVRCILKGVVGREAAPSRFYGPDAL